MGSFMPFTANTINGKILQFPKQYKLQCKSIQPIGMSVVRQFNNRECIQAINVFLVQSHGELLGTTQFSCLSDFIKYANSYCESNCGFYVNGCEMDIDNYKVTF